MPSLFTKIIAGEIPGRFVWKDETAVAFLTIAPITPGHTLVVPRAEVDHWIDLDDATAKHLMTVARAVGRGLQRAYDPRKVGMMIAGLEVPHTHLHVLAIESEGDLSFSKADPNASAESMDAAAAKLRDALRELGYDQVAE